MARRNRTIDLLIERSAIALTNAREADLQAVLAPVGYDPAGLDEGDALLATLRTAYTAQQDGRAGGIGATAAVRDALAAAHTPYTRHLRLARVAFAGDPEREAGLGLRGDRARARESWVTQGLHFYDYLAAHADARAALVPLGVDDAALTAARASVVAVETAGNAQADRKGEAQQATVARDLAARALRRWMVAFYEVARVATQDHPQLRERLGLRER